MRDLPEEQGMWVVGGGAPGPEALTQLVESRRDLVLIDIDVGEESGLALPWRLGEDIDGAKTDLSADTVRRMIGAGDE